MVKKRKPCEHRWAPFKGTIELTDDEWADIEDGLLAVFKCQDCGEIHKQRFDGLLDQLARMPLDQVLRDIRLPKKPPKPKRK